jgi:hypothetical protein
MTEDELFEDVKYWKGRADAAKAELDEALKIIAELIILERGSGEKALAFLQRRSQQHPSQSGNTHD